MTVSTESDRTGVRQAETKRYNVELPDGTFEDVGAANLTVAHGDLMFTDYEGELAVLYARGYWKTVTPEAAS